MSQFQDDVVVDQNGLFRTQRVAFSFLGRPQPQPQRRMGRGRRYYDPSSRLKGQLKAQLRAAMAIDGGAWRDDTLVRVRIVCWYALPANWGQRGLYPGMYCTNNVDVDNLAKFYNDVLSGVVIRDDQQIVSLLVEKRYAGGSRGMYPSVNVWVSAVAMNMDVETGYSV
jgi:Holliday junction resolvase RusA-like endonuclease